MRGDASQLKMLQTQLSTFYIKSSLFFPNKLIVKQFKKCLQQAHDRGCLIINQSIDSLIDEFKSIKIIETTPYIIFKMHQGEKAEKKLVKRVKIPIQIQDNPKQLRGVMRFSTESAKANLGNLSCTTQRKKNVVIYKNQNTKIDSQDEEEKRKKEIEYYEVLLSSTRLKNKNFKVEIPIIRGHKSVKTNRSHQVYFSLFFNNSGGKINLLNGQYEAKSQFYNKEKKEVSYNQLLQLQLSKLDNRRKEGMGQFKARSDSDD